MCQKWASLNTQNRGYINQQDSGEFFGWKGYGLRDDQDQELASGNYESIGTDAQRQKPNPILRPRKTNRKLFDFKAENYVMIERKDTAFFMLSLDWNTNC